MHDKPTWVCHFCGKFGHIHPNCFKLQVAKRANKPKVPMPQVQDPMVLIDELVKAFNLYSNLGVGNHSNVNKNFNAWGASKKFWMQKGQSKWVFLTWSLCFIALLFVTCSLFCFFFFWLSLFLEFFLIKKKKREATCVLHYFLGFEIKVGQFIFT